MAAVVPEYCSTGYRASPDTCMVDISVYNSATFPMLLLKSSKKVVILNEISSK